MRRWVSARAGRSAGPLGLAALLGVLALGSWGAYTAFAASAPPAPTITGKTPSTSPTASTSISFTFGDSQSGVTFQCSLDGASFAACSSPKGYTGLADGSHTFQVQAVAGGKASSAASSTWLVDTAAPTVSSINRGDSSPTKATSLHWTVVFSEPVKNVGTGNFAAVASGTGGAAPTVSSAAPVGSAPAASWTVTVSTAATTGSNTATVGLNLVSKGTIQDAAGNNLGGPLPVAGQLYAFDTQAPAVSSITRAGASPTNASSVSWTVTFSEAVAGVASGNFSLVQTGVSGTAAVSAVSGSGTTWTVTASTGSGTPSGSGTLELRLSSAAAIADGAGNALGGALPFNGQSYAIDKTPPAAPALDSTPPNPNGVSTSNFAWHDGSADVDHYLCSIENGAFLATVTGADGPPQPCASPLSYVVGTTNNGVHQFAVEAVDAAGNVSQSAAYGWKVEKGSIQDFTIDGNAVGLLYPGGAPRPIAVVLHNPNNIPIYVTSVIATLHAADFPAGCSSSAFVVTQASIPAAGVLVPANGAVTLPAQGATAPSVLMNDGGDQNACKNLTFGFDYSGSAHS